MSDFVNDFFIYKENSDLKDMLNMEAVPSIISFASKLGGNDDTSRVTKYLKSFKDTENFKIKPHLLIMETLHNVWFKSTIEDYDKYYDLLLSEFDLLQLLYFVFQLHY